MIVSYEVYGLIYCIQESVAVAVWRSVPAPIKTQAGSLRRFDV